MKKIWVGIIIVAGIAFVCVAISLALKEETGTKLVRTAHQQHALTNSQSYSTAAVAMHQQKQQRERNALLSSRFAPHKEQGATRAQLPQDTRQQALRNRQGQGDSRTVVTAVDRHQERRERNMLLARKFALIKERSALLKQGNQEALDANNAAIFAADASYINKQINKKKETRNEDY